MSRIFIAVIILLLMPTAVRASASIPRTVEPNARIPVVGCKSDGQLGPRAAPSNGYRTVSLSPRAANGLVYYKSGEGIGVLAPQKWYCFGTYGSSGNSLFVSPRPIDSRKLFSVKWRGFADPVIMIEQEYGGTSGRFGVATVVARIFPAYRAFVQKVMAEDVSAGISPPNSYVFGPYPNDRLIYRSKNMVEYVTPARTSGLGTWSEVRENDKAIRGVAILTGSMPDLVFLAVRLPKNATEVASAIVHQVEHDFVGAHSNP